MVLICSGVCPGIMAACRRLERTGPKTSKTMHFQLLLGGVWTASEMMLPSNTNSVWDSRDSWNMSLLMSESLVLAVIWPTWLLKIDCRHGKWKLARMGTYCLSRLTHFSPPVASRYFTPQVSPDFPKLMQLSLAQPALYPDGCLHHWLANLYLY